MHLRVQVTQPADPSYRLIALTHGQVAIVDAEDYPELAQFNWHASWNTCTQSYYARRNVWINGKTKHVWMHRLVMRAPDGLRVDHRDHDTLDNRKAGLRLATPRQNAWNQGKRQNNNSGFKGVSFHKRIGKWAAQINDFGVNRHLGYFGTPDEAAEVYREAATRLRGEFFRA
jgi:hypothetical protein